jgi:hypothetical protein
VTGSVYGQSRTRSTKLGSALTNAKVGLLLARESVHLIGYSIAPIDVMINTMLRAIYATMSVSLKKHHVKGHVQMRSYFVMENARRGLCNVTVNVWINDISLQIVMEPAHFLLLKIICVMGNARRGLYSVMVNVWMKIMILQIVMEPAQIMNLKVGFAILYVSPLKNHATENALKVNSTVELKLDFFKLDLTQTRNSK